VPSGTIWQAVAAAFRAARILLLGDSIDPLVSTISSTAFSGDAGAATPSPPADVTVITALTSVAPSTRNSFWKTFAENVMAVLSADLPR
jgi:hypothetical protein